MTTIIGDDGMATITDVGITTDITTGITAAITMVIDPDIILPDLEGTTTGGTTRHRRR
jgi:hypothetical protein